MGGHRHTHRRERYGGRTSHPLSQMAECRTRKHKEKRTHACHNGLRATTKRTNTNTTNLNTHTLIEHCVESSQRNSKNLPIVIWGLTHHPTHIPKLGSIRQAGGNGKSGQTRNDMQLGYIRQDKQAATGNPAKPEMICSWDTLGKIEI